MRGHLARLRCLSVGKGGDGEYKMAETTPSPAALPLPMMDFCVSEVALLEVEDEVVADHVPVVVAFLDYKMGVEELSGCYCLQMVGRLISGPYSCGLLLMPQNEEKTVFVRIGTYRAVFDRNDMEEPLDHDAPDPEWTCWMTGMPAVDVRIL